VSKEFIPVGKPIIDDEERVADVVLRSGMLAQDAEVASFEQELLDGRSVVTVNSGTAGLHLGLLAAGVGLGDEVIVPSFTFAATANSVALTGTTPVFADIELEHYCLTSESVASKMTKRATGIMPVHLYHHPANMTALQVVADEHGLHQYEDAAQAHGAILDGCKVGVFAVFSLYPTKNRTSGEGGMVSTGDTEREQTLRLLRNQGDGEAVRERDRRFQRPDDRSPRGDRAGAVDQGRRVDHGPAGERPVLRRQPGRCRRGRGGRGRCARLPPVHDHGARGPGRGGPGPDRARGGHSGEVGRVRWLT